LSIKEAQGVRLASIEFCGGRSWRPSLRLPVVPLSEHRDRPKYARHLREQLHAHPSRRVKEQLPSSASPRSSTATRSRFTGRASDCTVSTRRKPASRATSMASRSGADRLQRMPWPSHIGRQTVTCDPRGSATGTGVWSARAASAARVSAPGWCAKAGLSPTEGTRKTSSLTKRRRAPRNAASGAARSSSLGVARPAASRRYCYSRRSNAFAPTVIGEPSERMRHQGQHQFEKRAHLPRARRSGLHEHGSRSHARRAWFCSEAEAQAAGWRPAKQ